MEIYIAGAVPVVFCGLLYWAIHKKRYKAALILTLAAFLSFLGVFQFTHTTDSTRKMNQQQDQMTFDRHRETLDKTPRVVHDVETYEDRMANRREKLQKESEELFEDYNQPEETEE